MSMLVKDKRLQLLIDSECFARLEQEAKRDSCSVASLVREAIDERFSALDRRRSAAGKRLLALPMSDGPEPDWTDVKVSLELECERGLSR